MAEERPTSIQYLGVKPHLIHGAFLQVIRNLFSDPDNIEEPALKSNIWSPDPKLTGILIESVYKWKPEDIQRKPAVLVKRGQWLVTPIGLGNVQHGPPDETGFAEDSYVARGVGSHGFICLGSSGLEAELMGTEVYQCLLGFSAVIRQQFELGRFQVSEIGPISRFEESHDHFAVPISASYEFMINWKLYRVAPEWMRTGLTMEIQA